MIYAVVEWMSNLSYFDRLLLGWTLATYGPDKKVVVSAKDSEVQKLLMREKVWRDEIGQGVDYVQLVKLIKTTGCQVDGICFHETIQMSIVDFLITCRISINFLQFRTMKSLLSM